MVSVIIPLPENVGYIKLVRRHQFYYLKLNEETPLLATKNNTS